MRQLAHLLSRRVTAMNILNPMIDRYLAQGCGRCPLGGTPECKVHHWTDELKLLRAIALDSGLTEELKWKAPCYTFEKANVAMIGAFKENCVLSFFKGALLRDPRKILQKPGENSQAARVIRFTNVAEIVKLKSALKTYLREAIEIEKSGAKIELKAKDELVLPDELLQKFSELPELETAFAGLTPGRKRGYVLYFTAAQQSKTRTSRIEKYAQQILDGRGLHD